MKYEIIIIWRSYQRKSRTSILHVPKHIQNINKIPTIYFDEITERHTFYINQGKKTLLKIYEILSAVVFTLYLHTSKHMHVQTN